jgi:hypothetical protein
MELPISARLNRANAVRQREPRLRENDAIPREVPPPAELASRHFNDLILACLQSMANHTPSQHDSAMWVNQPSIGANSS